MNPKQLAGEKAAEYIENGMTVGLGTGSTAYWAIQKIGSMVKQGLQIKAVATSRQSESLARELEIPIVAFADIDHIDIDIDGADEVDPQLNLIKGGGGALLREKIIASNSRRFIVVADESKFVTVLGKFPLPVEVIPFAWELSFRQLQRLGVNPVRRKINGEIFITDNGNYIADLAIGSIPDPRELQQRIGLIPGVAENGLFLRMADTAVIGQANGSVKILSATK
ncbi:MAG TPA: ribose-5-phosphate isomerase RpiA [Chitinophagaceae bacterium]